MNNNEWDMGQTSAFCWCVERGVKPCANICVKSKYTQPILGYIASICPKLSVIVKDNMVVPGYTDIYVYKHSHIKDVIDALDSIPESVKHWYQGKLFGISDAEIEEFMSDN